MTATETTTTVHTLHEHPSGTVIVRCPDMTEAGRFTPAVDDVGPGIRYVSPDGRSTVFHRRGTAYEHAERFARLIDGFISDTDGF
jgi:hypothetical protein